MNSHCLEKFDKFLEGSIVCLLVAVMIFIFSLTIIEYDLWGHLKFGLDYIAGGRLLDLDPYSYITAGTKWIEHCWLFEVLIGFAYRSAGVAGLCMIKLLLALTILAPLLWQLIRHRVPIIWAGMLILLAALAMAPALFPLRPHLCTCVFFLSTLMILQCAEQGQERWLPALPLVFVIWCNSHGGYLSGLSMVCLWSALDLICAWRGIGGRKSLTWKHILQRAALVACCVAGSLVNPYGIELPLFLIRTLGTPRPEITEWQPLSLFSQTGLFYASLVCLSALSLAYSTKVKSLPIMALLSVAVALPLVSMRHVPLFTIAALVFCAPHIADALQARLPADALKILPRSHWAVRGGFGLISVISALALLIFAVPHIGHIAVGQSVPVQAVQLLDRSGITGNLATSFDWGQYCIWHLYPRLKVSYDGRREASYSPAAQALNIKFSYGLQDWDALLTKYPTTAVLASKSMATFDLMQMKSDYELVYQDDACGVFAHKGSEVAAKLLAAHSTLNNDVGQWFP